MLLTAFAPPSLLSLLSYTTLDHVPGIGTVHHELDPPISAINQENTPQMYPLAILVGAFSQLQFPLLQLTLFNVLLA